MNEPITIHFDMDGTIADLYGVDNWLEMLRNFDPTPYAIAKPLVNLSKLARKIHKAQAEGKRISIITWGSKVSSPEYDKTVAQAKASWLSKHLPSVTWDEFNFVPYGVPKNNFCKSPLDRLVDDEDRHRNSWSGQSFTPAQIYEALA